MKGLIKGYGKNNKSYNKNIPVCNEKHSFGNTFMENKRFLL